MLLHFFFFHSNDMSQNFISDENGIQVACPKIFIFFPGKLEEF